VKFITDPRSSVSWAKLFFDMRCIDYVTCIPEFNDDPYLEPRALPKLPDTVEMLSGALDVDPGVRLVGHKWLLNDDGDFFTDEVFTPTRISSMFNSDRDVPIKMSDDGAFTYVPGRRRISIKEKVGIAVASEPSNWGSFIFRVIPKLVLLKSLGCQKILVYCSHETQRQAIRTIGFNDGDIICHYPENEYVLESGAIYPMALNTSGYLSTFARVAFSIIPRTKNSRFGERLYISRGNSSNRKCVNENAVTTMLIRHGFSILYPGELTFSEQVEAFSAAKFIVGPSGAAMFNVVFCQPGTSVIDIESQRSWTYAHCSFFSSLGLKYGVFWGQAVDNRSTHAPYELDVDALEHRVKQCISSM